jgi:acyl-CoA reductase-like NAD-dependent aldehyde dehydrogenase
METRLLIGGELVAELARTSEGRVIPPVESSQLALVLKEPLGLVGCIVPWSYPLLLLAWKLDPATEVGPMVSAPQRDKVRAQVEAAVAAGAELVVGGDGAGHERGYFYAPAVVTGAPAETDLLREETFGPVAPIVPVKDIDEAIALANRSQWGLGANVYTRDLQTAIRCARELRAGTVWINDPLTDNDAGPFGGMKRSGLGRELGQEGLDAFQETKHVHIETKLEVKDWWYPYG